jgi:hypothetical protein
MVSARTPKPLSTQSDAWIESFLRDGYAHFPRLVPEPLIQTAHQCILRDLEENYDEKRLVEYNNQSWCPGLRRSPEILGLFETEKVRSVANRLLGKSRFKGEDFAQIAIRKAHNSERPVPPIAHIDGIPTPHNGVAGTDIWNFALLVGIFLTEVKSEYAGNFTVWPGTHLVLEKHFCERGKIARSEGMPAVPLGEPKQLLAKPGDVVFCHYELAHTAAANISGADRIAIFFRLWFNGTTAPEDAEQRWHNLTHIWHGWQIAPVI